MKKTSVVLALIMSVSLNSCFFATDQTMTDNSALLQQAQTIADQLKTLQTQIKPLQEQLRTIRETMKANGASRDDMKALQAITQSTTPPRPERSEIRQQRQPRGDFHGGTRGARRSQSQSNPQSNPDAE